MIIKCWSLYYKLIFWPGSLKYLACVLMAWLIPRTLSLSLSVCLILSPSDPKNPNTCKSFVFHVNILFVCSYLCKWAGYMWWDTLAPSKKSHILEFCSAKVNSHFYSVSFIRSFYRTLNPIALHTTNSRSNRAMRTHMNTTVECASNILGQAIGEIVFV